MIDFVEYVVSELKQKRLSKQEALRLIRHHGGGAARAAAALHPLVHRNTSELGQLSFAIRFDGSEFFLRDHRVAGSSVLPAVAYLEMARAALALALPEEASQGQLELRDLVWAQPVRVPGQSELSLLIDEDASPGSLNIEVCSAADCLHFKAQARFGAAAAAPAVSIDVLKSDCSSGQESGEQLYTAIARAGIELGPAQRGVRRLWLGQGQVLAELHLPESVVATAQDYVLHPSLLDSAVQAAMRLLAHDDENTGTPLPFALDRLQVLGPCEPTMWARARLEVGHAQAEARIARLDIDLYAANGELRLRMQGLSARRLSAAASAPNQDGLLLAEPCWEAELSAQMPSVLPRRLLLCRLPGLDVDRLAKLSQSAQGGCHLVGTATSLPQSYTDAVLALFDELKALLERPGGLPCLLQVVVPEGVDAAVFEGLSGLLQTAQQEQPNLHAQLLRVPEDIATDTLAAWLVDEATHPQEPLIWRDQEQRRVRRWRELDPASTLGDGGVKLRTDGVYLITGGLGGLGSLFAHRLLAQGPSVQVLLCGRAPLSEQIAQRLQSEFGETAARVHYDRLDPADRSQCEQVLAAAVAKFGRLDGILHAAGTTRDDFIQRKRAEDVRAVLAPKVDGCVHLDHASRDLPLDFLLLFSSGVSAFGNSGQADYAAANGFMDGFAEYRNAQHSRGVRNGLCLAIHWPLWQQGGMRVDAGNQAHLERRSGMRAMSTAQGMQAFELALQRKLPRLLVVAGHLPLLRTYLLAAPGSHTDSRNNEANRFESSLPAQAATDLLPRTIDYLRTQFAEVLKLAPQRIEPDTAFERYGIDSILAMDLTSALEVGLGSLPKTLFFENQSLRELAQTLVERHAEPLSALLAPRVQTASVAQVAAASPAAPSAETQSTRRGRRRPQRLPGAAGQAEPIAIVGISGRYPQSDDLDAFWDNLRAGRDCITEVPQQRWDWREYFSEDRSVEGHHYSKWGGFISGVDEFDPLFFAIPPVGAELIDPQERQFLQHAWMAIEDAGYTRAGLRAAALEEQQGQVGVYVGVMYGEYQLLGAESSLLGRRVGVPQSYASIANRVSYVLNLHGPSMTLDTMCSSSLTALHLACQDLRQGRICAALAGGVNISIHPNKYLILSAGQFISSDGHCQSFGEGGDGYIPGEGVGVVVLKRLSDAERDGDTIHGLILGSALNHGGRTNGYSVPNPKAQAAVIARALRESGVRPQQVGYVEAHGTGTKLGDPIEIAALTQVFRADTEATQFCAIGSAKSNIGHCESAAGIAGLSKVLLQMRHGQLVPSLHSAVLNPHIDFAATPFVVNQTLRPWPAPEVEGRVLPRVAGLSSFGAGGSNAHVLVQEYVDRRPRNTGPEAPVLLPLSARTPAQLRLKVEQLLAWLQGQPEAPDLQALAHTLQIGREDMDQRLAWVLTSPEQLQAALSAWLEQTPSPCACYQGQASAAGEGLSVLAEDEDFLQAVDRWIARRKLDKLAELWVQGLRIDWTRLYTESRPQRLRLPTYPFARERYWLQLPRPRQEALRAALHPLLQANTSDLFQQRYAAHLRGSEYFLADHQVQAAGEPGQRVLPGVAYLEMARAALAQALSLDSTAPIELHNVAWLQPLRVAQPLDLELQLEPLADDRFEFRIESREAGEAVLHCQGLAIVSHSYSAGDAQRLDLPALRARLPRQVDTDRLYASYAGMGLHYGPRMRALTAVLLGQGELLAELELPAQTDSDPRWYLPPALLDSALQSALALLPDFDAGGTPALPFALDALQILQPCPHRLYAWVRDSASDPATGREGLRKLDLDLCDAQGVLCLSLRGLSSRPLKPATEHGLLLARRDWVDLPAAEPVTASGAATGVAAETMAVHRLLLCDLPELDIAALRAALPDAQVHVVDSGSGSAQDFEAAVLDSLRHLQALLQQAGEQGQRLHLVVGCREGDSLKAGLSGLLDSARQEQPALQAQLLLCPHDTQANQLARWLAQAQAYPQCSQLRFSHAAALPQRPQWSALKHIPASGSAWRSHGVYLITGGLGGLGLLCAREILSQAEHSVVVLSGRAALDDQHEPRLLALRQELKLATGRLCYLQLDLADAAAVEAGVAALLQRHGRLDGVLHSAGTTRDRLLLHKSATEVAEVLAPKVAGSVNLDAATAGLPLDFFVLFSSLSAFAGNAGQADYAAANAFMDRFATQRNRLVEQGLRRGRSVSILWPLWQAGGMQLDADAITRMRRLTGLRPLQTAQGLHALQQALLLGCNQVLVAEGDLSRLQASLLAAPRLAPTSSPVPPKTVTALAPAPARAALPAEAGDPLLRLQAFLVEAFANLLQIDPHQIDPRAPLENYGIDSVLAMKLIQSLEQHFGNLSKTLLFEYQNLAALAAHLLKSHPQIVRERILGERAAGEAAETAARAPAPPAHATTAGVRPAPSAARALRLGPSRHASSAPPTLPEDRIAIIGLAGRYPQADSLREFWRNLAEGRDCISEVPAERWAHANYFEPTRNQPGKTYSKWGGFLSGIDRFDALFFNISPKEAELIDPQERLFLETVWHTVEDAGYSRESLAGRQVGVYVGVMWGQYELHAGSGEHGLPSSSFASVANRVSYVFDFHGPSLAVDSMCSSSLSALHLACEALRQGSVELAIAGGVNVTAHPNKYLSLSQGGFASSDGRCRSFGAGGDGYVPGEGVGAVLLKPLQRALADGDHIYGLVRASALNHGGKTNGYTVPNPVAQGDLIRAALQRAGLGLGELDYIETHGTGTSLGDPIEINGLLRAWGEAPHADHRLPIGSVKSNIGHLESAAGIAALSKVLLQFEHGQLLPSLHAEPGNPHIDFAATPFRVQTELADWPRPAGRARRAGISSFGAGGANAHLIIEEFIDSRPGAAASGHAELCLLSARTPAQLRLQVEQLIEALQLDPSTALADIATTLQLGRSAFAERLALQVGDREALLTRLRQWLQTPSTPLTGVLSGRIDPRRTDDPTRLTQALQQRDLAALAQAWVAGAEIDWTALPRAQAPRRIRLPGYPFARERHWIAGATVELQRVVATEGQAARSQPSAPVALEPHPATPSEPQLFHLRGAWQPSELAASTSTPAGTTLVLGLPGPLLDAAQEAIQAKLQEPTCVRARPARSFRRQSRLSYRLDYSEPSFARLLDALEEDDLRPTRFVQVLEDAPNRGELLERGLFSLHALCRTLLARKPQARLQILLLGQHAESEQAALHEALAAYLGSLAQENPRIEWKLVRAAPELDRGLLAQRLSDELNSPQNWNQELRYLRAGELRTGESNTASPALRRELRLIEAVPSAHAGQGAVPGLRQAGVYLISGGLGGLGYLFAESLRRQCDARLVLTGRSPLNAAARERLAALDPSGEAVLYIQADVAERAEVHTALETARQRFGAVHGVFHSAGVLRDAYVLQKSREDLQAVLAAKLQGCINLDRATRGDALDLFVLFSSVAAVFGNAGQADYAFANRFLDGFAERRQQRVAAGERQGRSLSINWPYWAEGGMQLDTEALARMRRQYGFEPLPSALGLDFLQQALAAEGSQHIALYGQAALLRARLWPDQAVLPASPPPLPPFAQGPGATENSIAAVESYLKGLLGEQIKLPPDRIDSEERFESYGLDSMMVGRLNDRLQADLGELPRTLFYEYASIAELAAHLQAVAAPALARCLRSEMDLPLHAAAPHPTQTQPNPQTVEAIAVAAPAVAARAAHSERTLGEAERYAIVGVHVRLPGADTLDAFWQALSSGADLVGRVPRERWDAEQLFDPDPEGRGIYCRDGAFLEDVDAFDAEFFGINEEDAPLIDPQERLFLQSAWAAFEDAGYTRDELKRRHPASERAGAGAAVGVFVGVTTRTYALLDTGTPENVPERVPGNMDWSIANRVSYVFDFQGPSLPVDTACSSSLVAIHQACESLRRGECQVALAGGVNLYLHPSKYRSLCRRRMLAQQGRCRSFGAGDDGFVPGEGVGAFVIKPLAQAEADGDYIYALIAGSACAHAGRSNGYSAPSPQAQGELIASLLQRSGIAAEKIGYVEAHGTGTQLGDSLEVAALSQAFRRSSEARQFCALGSVKSNLGHAEAAAGIAGMAKLLLQLRHRQIAATLHCQPPNPDLDLQRSPFRLPLQLEPWPVAAGEPRRALINGFGAGGVNASLLLEEYLPAPAVVESTGPQLILLSARDEARLREQVQALHARLTDDDTLDLRRLACTLQRGREAMPQRLAAVVPDLSALQTLLARYLAEGQGQRQGPGLWLGRVEQHQRRRPSAAQRTEAHSLYVAGEFAVLAERWIGGEQLDWLELQSAQRMQRLPLPTYPFERRRYWLQAPPANVPSTAPASGLHPLLRANVSTLQQTAFSAELSAHAWYARDHQVQGQAVLAGAIQLEIACVSAAMASEQPVRRIEDLVWMQPLVLGEARSNLKALLRSNGLGVDCLLVSGTADGERVLHSEARLICGEAELQAPAPVDLQSLRERALRQLDGEHCYRQLAAHGLVYGPGFRTLRELHIGADYALARLELAAERLSDFDQYLLHPSLIDGALQSVLGLASPGSGPLLPFAVDAIELHRPLLPQCLVLVEPARAASTGSEIRQFDLRILNGRGELLLLLRNFYVRGLASTPAPAQARVTEPAE